MPEIESINPGATQGRSTSTRVSLWMMGLAVILGVIGSLVGDDVLLWGFTCFFLASFLNALSLRPLPPAAAQRRQAIQIVAGLVAILSCVIAFNSGRGALGVLLGVVGIISGVAMLVPGVWPQSRQKFPRLFGERKRL